MESRVNMQEREKSHGNTRRMCLERRLEITFSAS
jgi:hypothetical protein